MGKIKVSKEVYKALDKALTIHKKEELLDVHANKLRWNRDVLLPLNELSNWKMAQILINGYEVEKTPEEKVEVLYMSCIEHRNSFLPGSNYYISWDSEAKGVVNCLNRLGIKIKGIND